MYGRRRYYGSRRREETGRYLRTAMVVLAVICIIVVCVTMALQTTKASQVAAAEPAEQEAAALIDEKNVMYIAQAATAGPVIMATEAVNRTKTQERQVIVIDPGHGGIDGGCVFENVLEKDINREIAWSVTKKLRNMGYQVVLVRQGDDYVDKMDRVEKANQENALLYVSIHQNSCEVSSVTGIETWYDENDDTGSSKRLAQLIQQETVKATGAVGRELVSDTELCVLNKSDMPACLVETGFLSNKQERDKLCTEEYREQVAEGIVQGIVLYMN
ncbi:MAG: N-acetylmuramoyl-L-alanine amidase [Lachnospiraceae bacterium]|nr:N-acetylmuramoyl-L-alanine amidase [Lachnospiraceae bacterium]